MHFTFDLISYTSQTLEYDLRRSPNNWIGSILTVNGVICKKWPEFKSSYKTIGGSITADRSSVDSLPELFLVVATIFNLASSSVSHGAKWPCASAHTATLDDEGNTAVRPTEASLKTEDTVRRWFTATLTTTITPGKEKLLFLCVCVCVCVCVCLYLHVLLCDLDLCCINIVHQKAQSPTVHLLYPHPFRSALCHLPCLHTHVRRPWPHKTRTYNQKRKLKQKVRRRRWRVLTCEHSVEVGAPCSQNHPVSSDLYILRHYGHVAQQALAVWAL